MWLLRVCRSLFLPIISQTRVLERLTTSHSWIFSREQCFRSSNMSEMLRIERKTVSDGSGDGPTTGAGEEGEAGPTATTSAPVPTTLNPTQDGQSRAEADGTHETDDSGPKKLSRRAMKRIMRAKHRNAAKEGQPAKKKKKNDTKELNFTEKSLNDADYYFENGLRKVYPYYFTFTTYAKGRWVGQKILDVFSTEFKAYDVSTYEKAITSGRVTVNGKKVLTEYIFIDNDYVENIVHRHELSVTAAPLKIVTETEDVVVVDKPSSIPIHPCGRYRHNSLTYLMAKEHGLRNLRTIYRLDRLTSGVFIFCKNDKQTLMMQGHIKNRKVEKTYLARVVGEFPSEPVECTGSIDTLSHKIGLFKIGPNGKEAKTGFKRLSYNGETSVVECKPHTGRTHQIRVHLQYLGYPIVNDPLYNSPAWGPNRGKGGDYGKTEEELVEELIKHHSAERFTPVSDTVLAERTHVTPETNPSQGAANTAPPSAVCESNQKDNQTHAHPKDEVCESPRQSEKNGLTEKSGDIVTEKMDSVGAKEEADCTGIIKSSVSETDAQCLVSDTGFSSTEAPQTGPVEGLSKPQFEPSKVTYDPFCEECRRAYIDPQPQDLVMFLHALSYSGPGWKFATEMPDWAHEEWKP